MEQIKAHANIIFQNVFLKYILLVLTIVIVSLSGIVVYLVAKQRETKIQTIFVNTQTGAATQVNQETIDATGQKRHDSEIYAFVKEFLGNLYTFNRYTIKSNLENAFLVVATEAGGSVKMYWQLANKSDYLNSGYQGLCTVGNIIVLNTLPDLKVQVFFNRKVLNEGGQVVVDTEHVCIFRIKLVPRGNGNPHGFFITEYREESLKKTE
jgi:type IV secretory pathway component VirB8